MPQNIETYLRNLQTTDAIRADAWDALHASQDPAQVEQRLRNLKGLSDGTRARLWDLRFPSGEVTPTPEATRMGPIRSRRLTGSAGASCSASARVSPGSCAWQSIPERWR